MMCVFSFIDSNTLNGTFESTVMKIALTEIVCSHLVNKMRKDAFLLIGNFHS